MSDHGFPLPDGGLPFDLRSHLSELSSEVSDLLDALQRPRAERAFGRWANNTAAWAEIARVDIRPWLTYWFSPKEDWTWDEAKSGRLGHRLWRGCLGIGGRRRGGDRVGVAWTYGGQHDINETFNGLRPTDRHVTVRGFTIMGIENDRFRFWRYIDWIDLYTQLGITINWRVPVGPISEP